MKNLYYLYAITDSAAPLGTLSGMGQSLSQVQFEQFFAIIDEVPFEEFNQEALSANLHQTEWLAQKVKQHHQLVLQLQLIQDSLVPIKFGSVFEQKESIKHLLASHKTLLTTQLQLLKGREEWNVKVYINNDKALQVIAEKDQKLQALQTEIEASSTGKAFFLKKKYDNRLQELTNSMQQNIVNDWLEDFSQWIVEIKERPLPPKDKTLKENYFLLKNLVVLAPKTTPEDWLARLNTLEKKYPSLEIALEGPWAAYHFVENSL